MRNTCAIREGFMNGSRTILPRVGGGVGVRGGLGVGVSIQDQYSALTVGAPRAPKFGIGSGPKR